jgi:hypothetical protein
MESQFHFVPAFTGIRVGPIVIAYDEALMERESADGTVLADRFSMFSHRVVMIR